MSFKRGSDRAADAASRNAARWRAVLLVILLLAVRPIGCGRLGAQMVVEPSGVRQQARLEVGEERRVGAVKVPSQRWRKAVAGGVVGAGVVGFAYWYSCTHVTECMSIVGAVPLMGIGAAVGAVGMLLVTPIERGRRLSRPAREREGDGAAGGLRPG